MNKNFGLGMLSLAFGMSALFATGCSAKDAEEAGSTESSVTTGDQLGGRDMPYGTYSLTFDDGPGPRTEELANYLGDKGIVATFFINGKNAPGYESALATIKARGHILANHTQNHEDMTSLSGGDLYAAVADTDAVIARYQPNGPWLLRAPYGAWSTRVSNEINGSDMRKYVGSIFWNVGGELTPTTGADWACWGQGLSVSDCAGRYMNEMNDVGRGIILMHDVHSRTVDMVKQIVESLAGQVRFVPITRAPQIVEAIGAGGGTSAGGTDMGGEGPTGPGDVCPSFTLGRKVPPATCVRRNDDGKWYVCDAASPEDWPEVSGPTSLSCDACPQLENGKCR